MVPGSSKILTGRYCVEGMGERFYGILEKISLRPQFFLSPLARGDIFDLTEKVERVAPGIAHDRTVQGNPYDVSLLPYVPLFHLEMFCKLVLDKI